MINGKISQNSYLKNNHLLEKSLNKKHQQICYDYSELAE
jgi:hypothetical protein